ncbi:Nucleoside diphosphate kinase 7 [Amphibalanus amphitrite]|uniref:Nucleoside diphosphate kinase 7 n=1 Tax=Amphibalanus amphitrite TaxID=1232801 RepID=A0A6A4WM86_AMPAM|nr:Nucleoside diphosphate kinase 7 [Amphibalanus amphitrite]
MVNNDRDKAAEQLNIFKEAAAKHLGKIVQIIEKQGLRVTRARMVQLERHEAGAFFSEAQHHCQAAEELAYLTAGTVCGAAADSWAPKLDNNCLHGSTGCEAAVRELRFFFPPAGDARPLTSARLSADGSCCVILPHVLAGEAAG